MYMKNLERMPRIMCTSGRVSEVAREASRWALQKCNLALTHYFHCCSGADLIIGQVSQQAHNTFARTNRAQRRERFQTTLRLGTTAPLKGGRTIRREQEGHFCIIVIEYSDDARSLSVGRNLSLRP